MDHLTSQEDCDSRFTFGLHFAAFEGLIERYLTQAMPHQRNWPLNWLDRRCLVPHWRVQALPKSLGSNAANLAEVLGPDCST